MAGMTAEQKAKFQELLGATAGDPLIWDSLPFTVRRLLVFASGIGMEKVFSPWCNIPDSDRVLLNRAAGELADWAEFTRQRMAQKPEGAAA